jgi:hypothetical protein
MNNKEGLEQLKLIYKIFMDELPLEEIDHSDIRLICKSYRNDNSSEDSCYALFSKHKEYFFNWSQNNRAINFFYGSKYKKS